MTDILTIQGFYPMLFTSIIAFFITIIILGIIIGLVIVKYKDSTLFQNIFTKSSDNAKDVTIDTTSKMKDMHDTVVKAEFTEAHEHEIHTIEDKLRNIEKQMQEISAMLTDITNRVIELEKRK